VGYTLKENLRGRRRFYSLFRTGIKGQVQRLPEAWCVEVDVAPQYTLTSSEVHCVKGLSVFDKGKVEGEK
jgi:hypothetical protein